VVHRFELLFQERFRDLLEVVSADIRSVSPETDVRAREIDLRDPWDFEAVYGALHGFARAYPFDLEGEEYLAHITTGSHVAQICMFLLTESRHFPGRLVQTTPPRKRTANSAGSFQVIDLDLSKYDRIATRFAEEHREGLSFLKSGIETRSPAFNALIERIERVAIASREPILLMGPTGAGKSQLARRIYELKKVRRQVEGAFVEINCATIRGDAAMSALFGHRKGAFTGAMSDRPGLLLAAHRGLLFLDEIAELGRDEEAMLLRAIEEKRFLPLGSDREVESDFQLIAGTNRDLKAEVERGRFREDLFARINIWTFELPGLRDRREDIEPNIEYELAQLVKATGKKTGFSREARELFLAFATSPQAAWRSNFRDLNAAIRRMATLALGGRITLEIAREEIERLKASWRKARAADRDAIVEEVLGPERASRTDRFDEVQLAEVLRTARRCSTISETGRLLFAASRAKKRTPNDADRLRKYLARFGLTWAEAHGEGQRE
jgi:transcriptional regulatory protein RtcR